MKQSNVPLKSCDSSNVVILRLLSLVGFGLVRCRLVGVDHVGERTLEAERNHIDDVHVEGDEKPSGTLVPACTAVD